MTEYYPPQPTSPPALDTPLPPVPAEEYRGTGDDQGIAEVARDQAADLGHSTVQAGKHALGVVQEQASGVATEAGRQGRDLLLDAREQLAQQAAQSQQRVASELLSLSDELSAMAGGAGQGGMAVRLADQAAVRTRQAGQWLDSRVPAQLVEEVQTFARRRPAAFLALAVGAGLIAGRLTRGLAAAGHDDQEALAPTAAAIPYSPPEVAGRPQLPAAEAGYEPVLANGGSADAPDLPDPYAGVPAQGGGLAEGRDPTTGAGGWAEDGGTDTEGLR